MRSLATKGDFVAHPYPVTPFHGDYLHHADLAAAASARAVQTPVGNLRIAARGRLAQIHPEGSVPDADWEVEATEVDAAELVGAALCFMNGWLASPWVA